MAAASQGYRPVLLWNAVPAPYGTRATHDLWPAIYALADQTPALAALRLPLDAPAAFILDRDRQTGNGFGPEPGVFDNRSVSLVTDFPSAVFLKGAGVERAVLLQEASSWIQEDLQHTLLRWQEAGIRIELAVVQAALNPGATPLADVHEVRIQRPAWYRHIWQRALAAVGLRRHVLGGFGGLIPIPGQGG